MTTPSKVLMSWSCQQLPRRLKILEMAAQTGVHCRATLSPRAYYTIHVRSTVGSPFTSFVTSFEQY